ncbi:MAG: hypothetical protein JWM33_2596 [Caulobacteraceae bacterium]|nr:hypothetical protein [Caulobacteraceae bacterium]
MTVQPNLADLRSLLGSARRFAGAFITFAGRRLAWGGGLALAGALLENVGLVLLIPILRIVAPTGGGGRVQSTVIGALKAIGLETARAQLAALLVLFVGLMLARSVMLYLRDTKLGDLQAGFVQATRSRAVRRIAAAPWSRIGPLRRARIAHLNTDLARVGASPDFVLQGGVALVVLAMQTLLVFALAPRLALVAVVVTLAGALTLCLNLRRTLGAGVDLSQEGLALGGLTGRFLDGLKVASAQNAQGDFVSGFETAQAATWERRRAFSEARNRGRLMVAVVAALAGSAIIWVGLEDTALSPSVLIVVILIFARMTAPLLRLYQTTEQFFLSLPAFEALKSLEAALAADGDDLPIMCGPMTPGPLVLNGASFQHPGGGGLHPTTLSLPPGLFLGVTGPSGAGKTTLVDLLSGLLQPQTGEMTAGGRAVNAQRAAAWRDGVAYVGQEPFLFHDTVLRNLTWGTRLTNQAACWRALEIVGAAELVGGMALGLETIIGERGARLSGGERQRLALARGLLRDPRLLVLDEATNAIDIAGEAALLGRLAALTPRPTIVMVAHRPESLVHCDRVVTIVAGRLTEGAQGKTDHAFA